jgi:hypothetical protein
LLNPDSFKETSRICTTETLCEFLFSDNAEIAAASPGYL